MNQYLGDLLSFRAGHSRAQDQFPEYIATVYADMDYETGRATTPLIDLTTGAPYYLFCARHLRAHSPQLRRLLHRRRAALARRRHDHSRTLARRAFARYLPPSLHRAVDDRADRRDVHARRRSRVCSTTSSRTTGTRSSRNTSTTSTRIRRPTNSRAPVGGSSIRSSRTRSSLRSEADERSVVGWYSYGANSPTRAS